MPKGLAVPVRPSTSGGFLTIEGDDNDRKIISLALGDDDNENAFQQDIGLGSRMVFNIKDAAARAPIVAKLRQIFKRFEQQKRYILRENTIKWLEAEGELILEFKYVNVESDEERLFRQPFSGSQAGARST